jgi:O-antigen ligase
MQSMMPTANLRNNPFPVGLPPRQPHEPRTPPEEPHILIRFLLGLLLTIVVSRLPEVIPVPGMVLGLSLLLLTYALLTGKWAEAYGNRPTLVLLLLTAWMAFAALLGIYAGGSVKLLVDVWSRSLLIYFAVLAVVRNLKSFRSFSLSMTLACGVIVLMSRIMSYEVEGRLAVLTSTLSNPNDLATALLICAPFCGFVAFDKKRNAVLRLLGAFTLLGGLIAALFTGSRSGLITMGALTFFLLLRGRGRASALVVITAVLLFLASTLLLPSDVLRRYQTILDDRIEEYESAEIRSAQGSALQRRYLFISSLEMTLRNPLFGAGPGNFADAQALELRQEGKAAPWRQTHNSFTQVSSECGIPAALAYAGLLLYCFRTVARIRKAALSSPQWAGLANASLCASAALLSFTVAATFSSIAYLPYFPMLAGMTVGLKAAAQKEMNASVETEAPPPVSLARTKLA